MTHHIPILLKPIVEGLLDPFVRESARSPDSPLWLVDGTFGGGGHCAAFLESFRSQDQFKNCKILALDRDADAIAQGEKRFESECASGRLELVHAPMSALGAVLKARGERVILGMLADLGFSSDQIDDSERGLSLRLEGPLDMRLDRAQNLTCQDYLQGVSEAELARVLHEYGEERYSRRIASRLVWKRGLGELPKTTLELAECVLGALPGSARHRWAGRVHPATRVFQALRIAVNGELEEIGAWIHSAWPKVSSGGRIGVLSFHSLEDRLIKQAFREEGWKSLHKKPIQADERELEANPRARSAKLRIGERVI